MPGKDLLEAVKKSERFDWFIKQRTEELTNRIGNYEYKIKGQMWGK